MFEFTIEGQPRPQERHRDIRTKTGKIVGKYDPSAKEKKEFLAKAMEFKPYKPVDYPITVILEFFFKRPKKHFYTTKAQKGELKPDSPFWRYSTPDIDNLIKFVTDALNTVFWVDDCLICEVIAVKHYTPKINPMPCTKIKVRTL